MPVDTISPYEIAYAAVEAAINAEFADLDLTVQPDELHESLGFEGLVVGVSPLRDSPQSGGRVVQETWFHIQWFDKWEKQVNPKQQVDPRPITRKAERLRIALKTVSAGLGDKMWFFNVETTDYPRDPTGNKTRFVMTVRGYGNNAALVETDD